jgi:hypothetical protein
MLFFVYECFKKLKKNIAYWICALTGLQRFLTEPIVRAQLLLLDTLGY